MASSNASATRRRLGGVMGGAVAALALLSVALGATAAPQKEPIVVGNIGSYSGAFATGRRGIREGLTAWTRSVNANGGINGHPIVLKWYDDGGDPAKAQTLMQQLITQDHVIAFLQNISNVTQSWQSIPTAARIPSINANTLGQQGLVFSAGTTKAEYSNSYVKSAYATGARSFAFVYCAELTVCSDARNQAATQAEKLGMKFTGYALSSSSPNYTAICLSLKAAGTQAVQLGVIPATIVRIADECAKQGVKPQYVIGATTISPVVAADPNLEGTVVPLFDFPWFQNDTPASKAFQFALGRYTPKLTRDPAVYNANLSASWAVGQVFAAAAAHVGAHPTSAQIVKGLFSLPSGSTFGGITPPETYKPSAPLTDVRQYQQPPAPCFFLIQLRGGKWGKPAGRKTHLVC
jgi:branched-chain amino acid transport system substrate-binding protein